MENSTFYEVKVTIQWKNKEWQKGREDLGKGRAVDTKATEGQRAINSNKCQSLKIQIKRKMINSFPIRWSVVTI